MILVRKLVPLSTGVIELYLSFMMRPFVAPIDKVVLAELEPLPLLTIFITFDGI